MPRLLTALIFYWLVPLVLLTITLKAAAYVEWGVPLALFTGLVTVMLVFLRIRRCPASRRQRNRPRWGAMGLILGCMAAVTVQCIAHLLSEPRHREDFYAGRSELVVILGWLPRPLNIFLADFKGKWLAQVNLRFANAMLANLQNAMFWRATLQDANLQRANLQGAILYAANLRGADLQGANLQGANLQAVKHLTEAQLQAAQTDAHTQLPDALQKPPP